jgi:superfamily II DNA or RNA helicase
MADIILSKKDESTLYIDCELAILYELKEKFTFFAEGYKFHPRYKARQWDGTICLLNARNGTLPLGLYKELVTYATESLGYEIEYKSTKYGSPDDVENITLEEINEFVLSLNLHSSGNPIEVRDYQIQALYNCIKNSRQISLTPTGGGKSLIAYCLYRWYNAKDLTFMLVVPSLSLIKQMYSDFVDYSTNNNFDVKSNTQVIAEGADKDISKQLILATWQSVYKQPQSWFNNSIDVIFGDELHGWKSESCKGIMEKSTEVKYRFGVTGSLDKSTVNKLVLKGSFGEISRVKSTRDLINEGYLCDIKIQCLILKYSKGTKKLLKDCDYVKEISFITQHEKRNNFIRDLALSQIGNTLILFNYVETHGVPLYEKIKEKADSQEVHFVSGTIKAADRELIRKLVQGSEEDNIIVASTGVFSTGINLPRIHNIIFAHPTKSVIKVIQSIGRGLRKSDDKAFLKLYDICDAINTSKVSPNYTYNHFIERLRIYSEEDHEYKLIEIELEKDK